MEIKVPSIADQQRFIFENGIKEGIERLSGNLQAPTIGVAVGVDESSYSRNHLLTKREGYQSPHVDIVKSYFSQFQAAFPEYSSDPALAAFLGLKDGRRIREFKEGKPIPYDIWRFFLVSTGRAPQEIIKVLGVML
ncbi:hypothetical protein [Shewanella algae]|uniref:hypothetical protein n=1 Tax=Shewanella algae TaxID=38313 RepID=UPI0031F5AD16